MSNNNNYSSSSSPSPSSTTQNEISGVSLYEDNNNYEENRKIYISKLKELEIVNDESNCEAIYYFLREFMAS